MTKEKFDKWLKNLDNIIVDVNICLNNAKILRNKDSEEIESIKREPYFQHHWYQLRFIMIIQLAKVFQNSGTQKIILLKLINRLANEGLDEEFNDLLKKNNDSGEENLIKSKADIIKTKEEIHSLLSEKNELISKLVQARNKLYAHHDPDTEVS